MAKANSSAATKSPKSTGKSKAKAPVWESRAVLRLIEAGSMAECPHCGERVKFRARHRDQQVICNIYEEGVWKRVEQYHEECYFKIGEPYGTAEARERPRRQKAKDTKDTN